MTKKNVIIIGAAGRDFHNFNTCYRNNECYNVVAFTAAQIPDIDGRKYPKELAGKLYPDGIPIFAEGNLPDLIKKYKVSQGFARMQLSYLLLGTIILGVFGSIFGAFIPLVLGELGPYWIGPFFAVPMVIILCLFVYKSKFDKIY